MRVTSGMITGQVIFNTQRSLSRLLRLQGQLSSGRRIERPSDDPVGTLRDLSYRNELSQNNQYLKNINRAKNWAQNYDTVLSDLKNLMQQAKDLSITMSDDSVSTESRIGSHTVAKSIYEQIGQLANGKLAGVYVFSGYQSETKALNVSADGAVYRGDRGSIEYPIEAAMNTRVNLVGDDVFLKQLKTLGSDTDLDLAITSSTLLANLNSGTGIDLISGGTFQITDENLGVTATIDISAATTIGDVITAINAQLPPTITNMTFGISGAGNALSIDIDESAPRLISDGTPLSRINEGHGMDLSYGRMLLTDGAGINFEVDFNSPSAPTTIGDLRNAFNTQMVAYGPPLDNVSMQLNAAGTGLEIVDANGVPVGLTVEEVNPESNTVSDLGLLGSVGASLTGKDLKPSYNFTIADIAGTTAADLGIVANIEHDDTGTDLNPILTAATAATTNLSDLNNGAGLNFNEILLWQGETSQTIDLSTAVTVQDMLDLFNNSYLDITAELNANGTGIQVINNDVTRSFSIEDVGEGRLTKELGLFGASDMLASLTMLTKSLQKDDREGVSMLMQNFDDAMSHLLEHRSTVGSNMARLEKTEYRLLNLELNYTRLLSEVEDADITKLITQLTTQENNYQASLMAAARIVQPTLVDFLR